MLKSSKSPMSRRKMLQLLGMGTAGAVLSACSPQAAPTTAAPAATTAPTEAAATSAPAAAPTTADAAATTAPAATVPATVAAAAEPEGEVVIWDRSGDLFQVFDSCIASFNQKYPKVTIKHEAVDIDAKLATTLTAGVGVPDGTFIDDSNIPALADFFTDISDWIKPYTQDIVPFKVRVNTFNDKIIGVPFDLDPALLFYRADLLEKAGIDPESIGTYDDLITAGKTIQEKLGADKKPIHIERAGWGIPLQLMMFANQQGASLINDKGELQLNSEPFLNAVKWIKNVVDSGLGSIQEYTSPGDVQAMESDQVVFYPWAIWFVYAPENLLKTSKGKWRAMPLPAWTPGGVRGANMGGSSFVIPKTSKNPQLAWLFYEHLMFSPDGYKTVYGPNKIYPGGLNTSLPSYLPAQKEQLFKNPEGLGGQSLWDVAVSTVKDIPGNYYYASWYGKAAEIIAANVQRMQDGQMSPEDVIQKSADDITNRVINR